MDDDSPAIASEACSRLNGLVLWVHWKMGGLQTLILLDKMLDKRARARRSDVYPYLYLLLCNKSLSLGTSGPLTSRLPRYGTYSTGPSVRPPVTSNPKHWACSSARPTTCDAYFPARPTRCMATFVTSPCCLLVHLPTSLDAELQFQPGRKDGLVTLSSSVAPSSSRGEAGQRVAGPHGGGRVRYWASL
jgi:hypothetical protein